MKLKDLEDKKTLILGLGKEGTSTLKFLRKKFPEKIIGIADQKELNQLDHDVQKIIAEDKKLALHLGSKYQEALNLYEIIIKSPGIRVPKPITAKITSQTELFIEHFKEKIIGITGTKGKTTTSSLIFKILKGANVNVELVGNIGNPPFDYIDRAINTDFFVFELSSFQLQNLKVSPHIAVFLNLYKEHLDYHLKYENYKKAKANIIKWQGREDYVIYNNDSDQIAEIVTKAKSNKIPLSLNNKLKSGTYISGQWIFFKREKVLKTNDTKLKGMFNLNNIFAAVSVAKLLGIDNSSIASSVRMFEPIKHRLELVGNFNGIDFYNDSIATIPEATIAALSALSPNVATLITGGYNRGVDYSMLAKKIAEEKIQNVILFPETGKIILQIIKNKNVYMPKHFLVKDMKEAVSIAKKQTPKGKICLLSPASSSFNMFKNYEDRGNQFVREIKSP